MKKLASATGVWVLVLGVAGGALDGSPYYTRVLTDNFNTSHNYAGGNVAGTIWSAFQINGGFSGAQNATLTAANAHLSNAGRLTLGSYNGNWENADSDGVLLYRNVAQLPRGGAGDRGEQRLLARHWPRGARWNEQRDGGLGGGAALPGRGL
jgi:hypothetical protein